MHAEGGHIALQILHAGRYGYHPLSVSASRLRSPITPFTPRALGARGVERQIRAFVRCAVLAREAGYDGVEVMGSEGYFINQFLVAHTNRRDDEWGGDYARRMRLPVEIVTRTREAVGRDFIIVYRLSMLDLIPDGSSWEEIVLLAKAIERAGASIINTGIGWHEARVPTIATSVPRAAFAWVTQKLKGEVGIPLCTTNRINTPEVAEQVLASGCADMVSMARPLLADADFVAKAAAGRADEINTCIACNQACLDHAFSRKLASCLVNPRACHETEIVIRPAPAPKHFAVVGAGPAGPRLRDHARRARPSGRAVRVGRAHRRPVQHGQADPGQGGVPRDAALLRAAARDHGRRAAPGPACHCGRSSSPAATTRSCSPPASRRATRASTARPKDGQAAACSPTSTCCCTAARSASASRSSAPVASASTWPSSSPTTASRRRWTSTAWRREWGVADPAEARGGLRPPQPAPAARQIYLLQRKAAPLGKGLGKTTGWIHRAALKARRVQMIGGVNYDRIDGRGLHVSYGEAREKPAVLEVDTIVICAGQEPLRELDAPLRAAGVVTHLIGGADVATELDAKRAIDQGVRLAGDL